MKRPPAKQPKPKKAPRKVILDREQRIVLENIARAMVLPYRDVVRARTILAFIDEWNEIAHPFAWTAKSFEKVLHSVDDPWRRRPHWSDVIATPTLKTAA